MELRFAGIEKSGILSARKRSVAAALNLLENRRPETERLAGELIDFLTRHERDGRHVIGITGPPGSGKSTLIARLVREYRSTERRVGVLAVDPSSRRSGGALLGDRARIDYDPADPELFIRSMAAGPHLGGLAWKTRHCLSLFEAAYDRILIETTGVGQSETEIEKVADTVVYVVQPGSGDSLQFMKAGIMEIPHVIVVNKADFKNPALKAYNDLQAVSAARVSQGDGWTPRVMLLSALEGWGQEQLRKALDDHFQLLTASNLEKRRRENRVQWVYLLFRESFGSQGVERMGGEARILERIEQSDIANPYKTLQALSGETSPEL